MISLNGERSLISAIIPPGYAHIDGVQSIAIKNLLDLVTVGACWATLLLDFFVKATGRKNLNSGVETLPWCKLPDSAILRYLRLNCLTKDFAPLWDETVGRISMSSPSVDKKYSGFLSAKWSKNIPVRCDKERRDTLVDLDVIVAQSFGLSLEQLIYVYKFYFPILNQYEAATWYDRNGRIVWTASKGLPGVGWLNERGKSPGRKEWDAIRASSPTELRCKATVDFLPGGPQEVERVFEGPFDTCNRIEDYKRAWAYFEAQDQKGAAA